jgi:hypothetical protein
MSIKHFFLLALLFVGQQLAVAQFTIGSRIITSNLNLSLNNLNTNTSRANTGNTVFLNTYNEGAFNIGLGYGRIKQENRVTIFGLGYNYSYRNDASNTKDTLLIRDNTNDNKSASFSAFAEMTNFVPMQKNWGFLYTLRTGINLGFNNNVTNNDTKKLSNDSLVQRKTTTEGAAIQGNILFHIGAYYQLQKHFLLFTQINILGAQIGYNILNSDNSANKLQSEGFGITLTGALTPLYKISDLTIGVKFLIPSKAKTK